MNIIGCALAIMACQIAPPVLADLDVRAVALNCLTCHADSASQSPIDVPSLAKQSAHQIQQALLDFKYDRTPATLMPRLTKGYSDQELAAIAEYIARD